MGRKPKPPEQRRTLINLTTHPDIRAWADEISRQRRRSISQLFEELVEAEWLRQQATAQTPPPPVPVPPPQAPQYFYPPPPYSYAPAQAPQAQQ